MIKLNLPLYVILPRKRKKDKRLALNLNIYRNTHFQVLNQAKIVFNTLFSGLINNAYPCGAPTYKQAHITYTLFPQTKRLCDVSNVCSVVDKFTQDSLVELGIIQDDNYQHITRVVYEFGSIDKDNPRCEIIIEGVG